VRKQHYLQACAQGSVLVYWGLYWQPVQDWVPFIAAQLLFAYAVDMLLSWSQRDSYALGFGPFPVVISVLTEAMMLALIGGLIGALIAYVFFNGMTVSTLGGSTFTQLVFNFRVTPQLVLTGMALALFIGFLGGLLPAVRAARMQVTTALREA